MTIDDKIRKSIESQFQANRRKNLFYKQTALINYFQPETVDTIKNHKKELELIDQLKLSGKWIDSMTQMALETFYNSNQFINVNKHQKTELREIYRILWDEIIKEIKSDQNKYLSIQQSHIKRLSDWLHKSNAFVKDINSENNTEISNVICAEYSALLQIHLLDIDIEHIIEPVLDVGCGENAWLVKFLRAKGVEVYGLDRLVRDNCDYLTCANWLEFDFVPMKWGTIVSNLSFALHFTNHNLRKDGDFIAYSKKFLEILNSLKTNGSFYYAPSLPFIESFLPSEKYNVQNKQITTGISNSIIKKIS